MDSRLAPAAGALQVLADSGFTHATGVPCSLLNGFFSVLESDESPLDYVRAPREDTALGVASGLSLAGKRPVVLMQNSGLGYSLNVLTSFNLIYKVGLPLIVSWRGHGPDAVEHDIIGRKLADLLDVFDIEWSELDATAPKLSILEFAEETLDRSRTRALIVTEGFAA